MKSDKRSKAWRLPPAPFLAAIVLAAVMIFACGGCGKKAGDDTDHAPAAAESASIAADEALEAAENASAAARKASETAESASVAAESAFAAALETPSPAAGAVSGKPGSSSEAGSELRSGETFQDRDPKETGEITEDTIIDMNGERFSGFAKSGRSESYIGLSGLLSYIPSYGISAELEGSVLTYRAHCIKGLEPVSAILASDSTWEEKVLKISAEDTKIDLPHEADDILTLTVKFSNDAERFLTIYVKEGEPWIVRRNKIYDIREGTVINTGKERIYGFAQQGWAGCGLNGDVRPFELYYGIYAEVSGSTVWYRAYSHLEDVKPVSAVLIRNSTGSQEPLEISGESMGIDLSQQITDAFTLSVKFSNDQECAMTIFVNGGVSWIANATSLTERFVHTSVLRKAGDIQILAHSFGVTPENSMGVTSKDIAYPTYAGREGRPCDTDLWRELAHEIVADDSLADSVKLIMIHDWMTANLAYDQFVADMDMSRANYYKIYDGSWNVYNIKAGVCRDFTNIFAIMCREMGMPCSSFENGDHTWSIVWMDGKWYDVDVTEDIRRKVMGEDITDITNPDQTVYYGAFLTEELTNGLHDVITAGHGVYTDKFARTGEW